MTRNYLVASKVIITFPKIKKVVLTACLPKFQEKATTRAYSFAYITGTRIDENAGVFSRSLCLHYGDKMTPKQQNRSL